MKTPCILPSCLSLIFTGVLSAAPVPGFFQSAFAPMLPEHTGSAIQNNASDSRVVSTGDGGWAVMWQQTKRSNVACRLRMLPPAFESPPAGAVNWTGGAAPAVTLASLPGQPACVALVPGEGGAWFILSANQVITAQWCSQAAGGPDGPPLELAQQAGASCVLHAAGDGTHAWVLYENPSSLTRGAVVLSARAADHRKMATFSHPGAIVSLTARPGRLLAVGRPGGGPLVTTTVDAAGNVSSRTMENPPAYWLGAVPSSSGYSGVYAAFEDAVTLSGYRISMRAMNEDGTWVSGAAITTLPGAYPVPGELTSGPSGGIVRLRDADFFIRANGTFNTLPAFSMPGTPGIGQNAVLLADFGINNDYVSVTRVHPFAQGDSFSSIITAGRGEQSEPSLGWGSAGLRLVHSLRRYTAPGTPAEVMGVNGVPGLPGTSQFTTSWHFSSPDQAWLGARQLVVWRNETAGQTGDNLAAAIYTAGEDGALQLAVPEFPVTSGASSQRGVSVNTYGTDRFLIAWREETGPGAERFAYNIRAAFVSPDGTVTPPGGFIVDTASYELSSVSVAANGYLVWRAFTINTSSAVIRGAQIDAAGNVGPITTISPPDKSAAGASVTVHSTGNLVVWRDRDDDRIYGVTTGGSPFAVSPAGKRARESVAVSLANETSAILWIEEDYRLSPLVNIRLATIDRSGLSEPVTLLRGMYDRDTLAVASDGYSRIAFTIEDTSGDSPGLRTFLVAPQVQKNAGLEILPTATGRPMLQWDVDSVFAHSGDIVERSEDLRTWGPVSGTLGLTLTGRATFIPNGTATRSYYRLRANTTGAPRPTP